MDVCYWNSTGYPTDGRGRSSPNHCLNEARYRLELRPTIASWKEELTKFSQIWSPGLTAAAYVIEFQPSVNLYLPGEVEENHLPLDRSTPAPSARPESMAAIASAIDGNCSIVASGMTACIESSTPTFWSTAIVS